MNTAICTCICDTTWLAFALAGGVTVGLVMSYAVVAWLMTGGGK